MPAGERALDEQTGTKLEHMRARISRLFLRPEPPLARRRAGRGGRRGRGHHRADLPAARDRAGGVERRRVPAGRAAGRHAVGPAARAAHQRAERRGVQLLPPAADREVHDRGERALGRADRVPRGGGGGERGGRGGALPGRSRPSCDDARRTSRPSSRACCSAGRACDDALPAASDRLATALGLDVARITLDAAHGDAQRGLVRADPRRPADRNARRRRARAAGDPRRACASGSCPRSRPCSARRWSAIACKSEVVETRALRRSDELKTALLQTVSHDLRTPLTAIMTAGAALAEGEISRDRPEGARAARSSRRPSD